MDEKEIIDTNQVEEFNNTVENKKVCYIACDPEDRKTKEYLTIKSMMNERGYNVYRTTVYDKEHERISYKEKAKPILNPIERCDIFIIIIGTVTGTALMGELEVAWMLREQRGAASMIKNLFLKPLIYGVIIKEQDKNNYAMSQINLGRVMEISIGELGNYTSLKD